MSCLVLRNYTQCRQIGMPHWLHGMDSPVQFTWPHTCEASFSSVNMNVLHLRLLWETCPVRPQQFDEMKNDCGCVIPQLTNTRNTNTEPNTYVVCFGPTDLTRISEWLELTRVCIWRRMGWLTHPATTYCEVWRRYCWIILFFQFVSTAENLSLINKATCLVLSWLPNFASSAASLLRSMQMWLGLYLLFIIYLYCHDDRWQN